MIEELLIEQRKAISFSDGQLHCGLQQRWARDIFGIRFVLNLMRKARKRHLNFNKAESVNLFV